MQHFIFNIDMTDGTEHRNVAATIADQVAFSTTRARHKWPTMQDDPLLFQNFLAFSALRRTGAFAGGWDDFAAQALAVELVEAADVDPTVPTTTAV
ncbi:tail assembly chaperone [Gordonia phage Schiebs]|nr:tail assembly chaperone [Gordonia phage Schiebs]